MKSLARKTTGAWTDIASWASRLRMAAADNAGLISESIPTRIELAH